MPCEKGFWTRKNLLRQNCSHPPANAFLIDFGVILRSKIPILRVKARRKMRKRIVVGQFGSTPVRLMIRMLTEYLSILKLSIHYIIPPHTQSVNMSHQNFYCDINNHPSNGWFAQGLKAQSYRPATQVAGFHFVQAYCLCHFCRP